MKKSKDASPNEREAFQKHIEIMKEFRTSHPDREIKVVTPKDILTSDGNLLAPVANVKLDKHKQN
jgi:hypothetical protein